MPFIDKKEYIEYQNKYHSKPENREKAARRSRKWYENNKERSKNNTTKNRRIRDDRDRVENPKAFMLRRTKNSAKTRGIVCTITVDDFHIPSRCPILGIPLQFHKGQSRMDSPSMDRIDNDKGYIPGNVLVISKEANRLKADHTEETLRKLLDYISNPEKYKQGVDS